MAPRPKTQLPAAKRGLKERTRNMVELALTAVLPPLDSDPESSEDEDESTNFSRCEEETPPQNVVELFFDEEDDIEDEILLDPGVTLDEHVEDVIARLEEITGVNSLESDIMNLPSAQLPTEPETPETSFLGKNSTPQTLSPLVTSPTPEVFATPWPSLMEVSHGTGPSREVASLRKFKPGPSTPTVGGSSVEVTMRKSQRNEKPGLANKSRISKKKVTVRVKKTYSWSSRRFKPIVTIPPSDFTHPDEILSPIQYFKKFFDDSLVNMIVEATNLYSVQETAASINLTATEFWDFISILLLMGVIKVPQYTDHWSRETNIPLISCKMPLKRFQTIRRYIHFCDNSVYDKDTEPDRYFKIRPFLEKLRANFLKIEPETQMSIDEMMIPYKGTRAGSRKQYMPKKPKKWGFKAFVRSGVSGVVYDFIMYGGEATFFDKTFLPCEEALFGLGGKIVLTLCKTIDFIPSAVYMDNFFTSLELIEYMRENYGLLCLGTIRQDRLRNLKMISDKDLIKQGRGSFQQKTDNKNKLCVVKWADTKCVTLASSFVGAEPVKSIKRYCKQAKTRVDVQCPGIISEYNSKMGGVDLTDMLISLYRTNFKPRKWYLLIFSQFLDICVNNAWLLYRRDLQKLNPGGKYTKLKQFRIHLADLLFSFKKKSKISLRGNSSVKKVRKMFTPRPQSEIRYDGKVTSPCLETNFLDAKIVKKVKQKFPVPNVG